MGTGAMKVAHRTINLRDPDGLPDGIRAAAEVLDQGGVVVFPTETVYGIGVRADRADAIRRLHAVKEREASKPFTVHIGRRSDAERYVNHLDGMAKRFARKGWPGPLTLVLTAAKPAETPIASSVDADALLAMFHENTIGLRCPDDRVAGELLRRVGGPVVAASANRAGHPPPTTAEQAIADLDGDFDLALDAGPARYNCASTIVRVDGSRFHLLREGVFDERMIRGMAELNILFVCTGNTCRSPMAQGIAERMIAEQLGITPAEMADRGVHVRSAGTAAMPGFRAAPHAVDVLAERNIDIGPFTSRQLNIQLINQADHIFTMTRSHRAEIIRMVPSAEDKTVTLAADQDISDPLGGDRPDYAACAQAIEKAWRERFKEIEL